MNNPLISPADARRDDEIAEFKRDVGAAIEQCGKRVSLIDMEVGITDDDATEATVIVRFHVHRRNYGLFFSFARMAAFFGYACESRMNEPNPRLKDDTWRAPPKRNIT